MEQEFHQFASQMVAAFLEARGWEIRYWGTALPVSTAVDFLRQEKPRLLCISLTMTSGLPALFQMLGQIREDAELRSMKVLVGGQAFQDRPDTAVPWGADASTPSLEQGLDLIERWGM
jgi:methanogenic corrinoid protein MtbC1